MPIPPFREDGWLPIGHHPAEWEEVSARFGGGPGSRRLLLTARLFHLRDALRLAGVRGTILLDGSYISDRLEPGDFDILLIGPADIQIRKDSEMDISSLLDARAAEEQGYSLFFIPADSPAQEVLSTLWDFSKEGIAKGVVEIIL